MNKTKIVLDADVVIHFIKGECFNVLFEIFPNYEYIILDTVYSELSKNQQTRIYIDNISKVKPPKMKIVDFKPTGSMMEEYARLLKTFGKGESACMIYCSNNQDVLASSNLKDIKEYCESQKITYLTTLDFLYYAYTKKKMTRGECNTFIQKVIDKRSKLPSNVDISTYSCSVQI